MTVYGDVLFFINFSINLLILYATGKIGRVTVKNARLLFGSALGALYAVLMFFPRLSFGYSMVAKFLFSLFVIAVTFNLSGFRLYIKTVGIFYLVTVCLGGGVMAIFYFTNAGAKLGAVVKNGILYFSLPMSVLLSAVALSYIGVHLGWRFLGRRLGKSELYRKIGIVLGDREVWIDALLDTGNALTEPFSGAPVIVAEYQRLLSILPPSISEAYKEGKEPMVEAIQDESLRGRLRLIPFTSLGREHGMLLGFCPDKVQVLENESLRDMQTVVVGIYKGRLCKDLSYGALLPPSA